MYAFADYFFVIFHTGILLFNLLGWIWKRTRRANLLLLLATAFSWFILGIWYGIGYCPCTDWHWIVLRKLGREDLPNSYVKYLLDRVTGIEFDPGFIDTLTGTLFALAFLASVYFNLRDYRSRKAGQA